jgi:hypothetical protein
MNRLRNTADRQQSARGRVSVSQWRPSEFPGHCDSQAILNTSFSSFCLSVSVVCKKERNTSHRKMARPARRG